MKCYTTSSPIVTGSLPLGIPVEITPNPHIVVGAEGKGRQIMRVPVNVRLATRNPISTDPRGVQVGRIDEASAVNREDGFHIIEPFNRTNPTLPPDERALVLLSRYQGPRGHSQWSVLGDDGQWLTPLANYGDLPVLVDGRVLIIACGAQADGAAGCQSQGPAFLAIIWPGTTIRWCTNDRSRGQPRVLFYTWDTEFRVTTPREIKQLTGAEFDPVFFEHPRYFKEGEC